MFTYISESKDQAKSSKANFVGVLRSPYKMCALVYQLSAIKVVHHLIESLPETQVRKNGCGG